MSTSTVRTPCIGVCSTTFGDTVCRGCKRFLHEIVDWNRYSEAQKAIIWRRLDSLLTTVVDNYFAVTDPVLLAEQLAFQNIRRQPQLSPAGWVPELLKAAGPRELDWPSYGLRYLGLDSPVPRQLYDQISAEVYALAQAHYDRNHKMPGLRLKHLLDSLTATPPDSETC